MKSGRFATHLEYPLIGLLTLTSYWPSAQIRIAAAASAGLNRVD